MAMSVNYRYSFFTPPTVNYQNVQFFTTVSDPTMIPGHGMPITFIINSDNNYINFAESYFKFKIKITGADGQNIANNMDNQVAFEPNIFHSVWSMVRVRVNDFLVTPSSDIYSYKAFIETLFASNADSKNSDLLTDFQPDTGARNTFGNNGNDNFRNRSLRTNRSVVLEVSGQLCVDFLKNSRNVLPNSKVEITLFPKSAASVIHRSAHPDVAAVVFDYRISDPQFFVRREEIIPSIALAIETRLSRQAASYHYPLSVIKPYHLADGIFNYRAEDCFSNQLPLKILVCFVDSAAYNGSLDEAAFYFNPSTEIENIEFFKSGLRVGLQRVTEVDLRNNSSNLHSAYRELESAVSGGRTERGLPFSLTNYRQGYFFYGVDLTTDGFDAQPHRYPVEAGSLSVHVKFRNALPRALQMLVYGTFQETLTINKSRGVTTTINV